MTRQAPTLFQACDTALGDRALNTTVCADLRRDIKIAKEEHKRRMVDQFSNTVVVKQITEL